MALAVGLVLTVLAAGTVASATYPGSLYTPTTIGSNKWCDPGPPVDCRDAHELYAFGSGWPDSVKTAVIAQIDYMNTAAHKRANTPLLSAGTGSTATVIFRYAESDPCGTQALACSVPNRTGLADEDTAGGRYTIYFRADGRKFTNSDGSAWYLKWCQLNGTASGCFDARNIALHEIGHFLGFSHWAPSGLGPGADITVMQTQSRANKSSEPGWNAHDYGTCDYASLQLKYDIDTSSDKYSDCLPRQTTSFTGFATSATSVAWQGSVTFSVNFGIADDGAGGNYALFENNTISDHAVILQRSTDGFATKTSYPMTSLGSGSYSLTLYGLGTTATWRVTFATPSDEGLSGTTSGGIIVTVRPCTGQCPI